MSVIHCNSMSKMVVVYLFILCSLTILQLSLQHSADDAKNNKIKTWSAVSKETNEKIDVHLSKGHQDRYDVLIDMHRPSCENEVLTKISSSDYTDQFAKMFMGPDEFLLNVEGKEILAHVPKYTGCGLYHASFHLLLTGAYHIKVTRLRSNFTALNEFVLLYPPMQYENIVTDWIELAGSKSKYDSCHNMHYGAWIQKSLLPITAGTSAAKSIFDTVQSAQSIVPIDYHGGDDRNVPIKSFVPLGSEHSSKGCILTYDEYAYMPVTGCHWTDITAEEASKILSGKKLAIAGDSHMRIFGNLLLKWACDIDMPFKKGQYTHLQVEDSENKKCRGMSMSYSANYYCSVQSFTWHPWKIEDFILLNCGHHAASQEHQPIDVYRETMINFVKHAQTNVNSSGISQKNFIWAESNPQPIRNDRYVFDSQDWRTEHRLSVYNQIANNLWSRHNFSIIYTFQQLLPFAENGCDYAHYSGAGALYPVFMQYLHILRDKST